MNKAVLFLIDCVSMVFSVLCVFDDWAHEKRLRRLSPCLWWVAWRHAKWMTRNVCLDEDAFYVEVKDKVERLYITAMRRAGIPTEGFVLR